MGLALLSVLLVGGLMFSFFGGDDGDSGASADADQRIEGDEGDEIIEGGTGDDLLSGNGGDDILSGAAGDDRLSGGPGENILFGGAGDDVLRGGANSDLFVDDQGADTIKAYAGDDQIISAGVLDSDALLDTALTADATTDFTDIVDALALDLSHDTDDAADVIDMGPGDDLVLAGNGDTITTGDGFDDVIVGDWGAGQDPVTVTDFDPAADLIVVSYGDGTSGDVLVRDTEDGDAAISLDGETIAILQGVSEADLTAAGNSAFEVVNRDA